MILAVVSAKHSTMVNLNSLLNHVQMNTKDVSRFVIVKRMKLRNTLAEIKIVDRESRLNLRNTKKTIHSYRKSNHISQGLI